jgi:hypothetical protein
MTIAMMMTTRRMLSLRLSHKLPLYLVLAYPSQLLLSQALRRHPSNRIFSVEMMMMRRTSSQ